MIEAKALTEEQCIEARLPPKGIFPFQVERCEEKHSDKVGDFLSLRLKLKINENAFRVVFDALFFREDMLYKTRHFYQAIGKMDIYESGKFYAGDLDWAQGYVEVDHRTNKKSGEIECYVKDYIKPENEQSKPSETQETSSFNDSIPF